MSTPPGKFLCVGRKVKSREGGSNEVITLTLKMSSVFLKIRREITE